jgi:hypothetical protein
MAEEKEPKTVQGVEIDVSLLNPAQAPRFEPVIKKIAELVREVTGNACSQTVATKMRW